MLKVEDVAAAADFALTFSKQGVVEEMFIRHLGGDFWIPYAKI